MITLTKPDNGWITLSIRINETNTLLIEFSDVGPNTLQELSSISNFLKSETLILKIYFFLEPNEGELKIVKNGTELKFNYFINATLQNSFKLNKNDFNNSLSSNLKKIIPLCHGQNWTQ